MYLFSFLLFSIPFVQGIIKGYNFYGLETNLKDFTCTWKHPVDFYVNQLQTFGFNSIRVPFSKQWVDEGDFSKMDNFIQVSTQLNMTILLDFHRVDSDFQSANPFNDLSLTQYTDAWITVLNRYVDNPNVFAAGLFNEFQGGDEKGEYWSEMMRQTISKIELSQPVNRWIYFVGGCEWGGNLHTIDLENEIYSDRVRYEIHKYHFSGLRTREDWDYSFGNHTGKVILGEWAINRDSWDDRFISYLIEKDIKNNYYWTVSNSGDTINLWQNDCETINWDVINKIKLLWDGKRLLRSGQKK